jgi:hypothetical protein
MMYSVAGGGGRKAAAIKVVLNVYDIVPNNDWAYSLGLGIHHSGVEIAGLGGSKKCVPLFGPEFFALRVFFLWRGII